MDFVTPSLASFYLRELLDPLARAQVGFLEEGVHSEKLWLSLHLSLSLDVGLSTWQSSLPSA